MMAALRRHFFMDLVAKVEDGLKLCGIDFSAYAIGESSDGKKIRVGLAVSGGADSVAMMLAFSFLSKKYNFPIFVITVNHNIREEEETLGDAVFVKKLCEKLSSSGNDIFCEIKTLERGEVFSAAEKRGGGVEEAARFLRYRFFGNFLAEHNLDFICTAHTKDDQLETIVMRFFQGSGVTSGIKRVRGKFIRPLLDVERSEIEEYLKEMNVSWRCDSTNKDVRYSRNKIRNILVPQLDENFPGWKNAVLAGSERAKHTEDFLLSESRKLQINIAPDKVFFNKYDFFLMPRAVRIKAVFNALSELGVDERVPYSFAEKISAADAVSVGADASGKDFSVVLAKMRGLEAGISGSQIYIKKSQKVATETGFFAIIENDGEYDFPFGKLMINGEKQIVRFSFFSDNQNRKEDVSVCGLSFPFCVRSKIAGDKILCSDGNYKTVSDILSSWKIPVTQKDNIPLVQDLNLSQEIVAILGCVIGLKNWIVKLNA